MPLTPWPALNTVTLLQRGRIPFRPVGTTLSLQQPDLFQEWSGAVGEGCLGYRLFLTFFLLIVKDTMIIAQIDPVVYRPKPKDHVRH